MIKKVSITEYEYKNVKDPVSFDGYRIAVMSELHCNEIGENNSILLNIIYDLDPDAIMFAGDMVNSNAKNMHVTSNFLTTLSYEYPVFVSCGNHELKLGTNRLT